jgi:uncharacterized protein with HEPN domain
MNKGDRERIAHIKTYCMDIVDAVKHLGDSFDAFLEDIHYANSISMSIMQIGELSVGLSDTFKSETHDKVEWVLIRGMRNMFAHSYIKMDKEIIWDVATNNILALLQFCDWILLENASESDPDE